MKKLFYAFVALVAGLAIASCAKEYDDTLLKDRVQAVEDQVKVLNQKVTALTEQVSGLAETIDQWKKGGFVEKIQENKEGDVVVSYTITFVGGKTVTLYNGKDGDDGDNGDDGDDGSTPEIILYEGDLVWAIDGEPILIDETPVPATVIPTFEIDEDGCLIMTLAGEKTNLGKVKGEDGEGGAAGDSILKSIEPSEDGEFLVFTLNGTPEVVYSIPFAKAFKLIIENPEQEVKAGDEVKIDFTVQNGEGAVVDCFASGNYTAKIVESQVVVNVPDPFQAGQVLVWAQNEKGLFSMVKLSFTEEAEVAVVTPADEIAAIPGNAGEFEINLTSNIDVKAVVPADVDWVTAEISKANYTLTLTLAANETAEPREAEIAIVRADNEKSVTSINIVQLVAAPKELTLERVWGYYTGTSHWTVDNIQYTGMWTEDNGGMCRTIAMDDEYIYLPKSSGYPEVIAVSIADPSVQVRGDKTGLSAGTATFKSSCVRMIKNTDPTVNDGKDVLLLCNLTVSQSSPAKADEHQLRVWAYTNGIASQPTQIAAFLLDPANDWVADWRRYGDRFFVTGTWQDGKLYFPSFNAGKSIILSVANGAKTALTQITATTNSPDGIKDLTVYPGDNKLFITNNSIANLVASDGTKTNGWDTYVLNGSSENGVGTWGYNFFSYNEKNYIAYARLVGEKKAHMEIIEDNGDLLSSLAAQAGIMKAPIQHATDIEAEIYNQTNADCAVRVIDDVVYIASMSRGGGLVLDKLYLK